MELLIYLIGNLLVNVTALIPLREWYRSTSTGVEEDEAELEYYNKNDEFGKNQKVARNSTPKLSLSKTHQGLVSVDLQCCLLFGSILRCYWSLAPPVIWTGEETPVVWLAKLDLSSSPLLWFLVVMLVGRTQIRSPAEATMSIFFTWPMLCLMSLIGGFIACLILPSLDNVNGWLFADVAVVANMMCDSLAMVPQMYLAMNDERKAKKEVSHFVGLLCLGRVLRMLFWALLLIKQLAHVELHGSHYIWTFVLPDLLHTLVMGDYLYIWLKKIKRDQIDPIFDQVVQIV